MPLDTAKKSHLNIQQIADISEVVTHVQFSAANEDHTTARSTDIYCKLRIEGTIGQNAVQPSLSDALKGIVEWSLVAPNNSDCYKAVTVTYRHNGASTTYHFPFAFPISYQEDHTDEGVKFVLVVGQKKDRLSDISVE